MTTRNSKIVAIAAVTLVALPFALQAGESKVRTAAGAAQRSAAATATATKARSRAQTNQALVATETPLQTRDMLHTSDATQDRTQQQLRTHVPK